MGRNRGCCPHAVPDDAEICLMLGVLPTAEVIHALVLPSFDQKYPFTSNNGEGTIDEKGSAYAPVSTLDTVS